MLTYDAGLRPSLTRTSPLAPLPLRLAVLNLMPAKQATLRQLGQLLDTAGRPYQLEVFRAIVPEADELRHPDWVHAQILPTTTALKQRRFDGLIITGAPVGQQPFETVSYWRELQGVFDWSRQHVRSTLNICWASAAALYHFHNVERALSPTKLFGVFPQHITPSRDPLLRGLENGYAVPVSRYSYLPTEALTPTGVRVLAHHAQAGVGLAYDRANRQVLSFNHPEYDADTLAREYQRDVSRGLKPALPINYFPDDNPQLAAPLSWAASRRALAGGWLSMLAPAASLQPRALATATP